MDSIIIKDKTFKPFISSEKIQSIISDLALKINHDYKGKNPIFLSVMNGAFLFTADLFKQITLECEIAFIKVSSYHGTASGGKIKTTIGLDNYVSGRDIIILEDIVDTGITIEYLANDIVQYKPASVKIATLLFKPAAFKKNVKLDYVGFEIPNDFIVGFGLDYDQLGRNLKDIYKIDSPS
jgi:hypoxanthine phosphoribosyltransferase